MPLTQGGDSPGRAAVTGVDSIWILPDIDSLALFVRAAELGNLTRAAEASFIIVFAASRLSLLEHQF